MMPDGAAVAVDVLAGWSCTTGDPSTAAATRSTLTTCRCFAGRVTSTDTDGPLIRHGGRW